MATLAEAIEALYRTFAHYPLEGLAGCPCCVDEKVRTQLVQKPLRDLGEEDLASYVFNAPHTWGTVSELKYFLPRILELKAQGKIWVDLQTIYGKFGADWPDAERAVLLHYTQALLLECLDHARIGRDPCDVIESAGVSGMDVRSMLHTALQEHSPARATGIACLVLDQATVLASGRPQWIWWRVGDIHAFAEWMILGDVGTYLMTMFEQHLEHENASDWAAASDVLEAMQY